MEIIRLQGLSRYVFWYCVVFAVFIGDSEGSQRSVDTILVLRSPGDDFEEAVRGISFHLGEEFFLSDAVIHREDGIDTIGELITTINPAAIVTMNNIQIDMYTQYQHSRRAADFPPAIALMAASVGTYLDDMENAVALEYEVPVVTGVLALRTALNQEVRNVGIVYRDIFSGFIERNREYCRKEDIELVTYRADSSADVADALEFFNDRQVDAVWIPNDNVLLTEKTILYDWIPFIHENQIAAIVGVENLVNPAYNFATAAVVPDNAALGQQVSNIILDLRDNQWRFYEKNILIPPLSVNTIINASAARMYFDRAPEDILNADRVWE
jgi:putative ABC transport system substrate-binding protein